MGWRSLISLNQPDVLVCDHAPTAILATRGLGIPTLAMGTSFELPPLDQHFPPMAYWVPNELVNCAAYDAHLQKPCNEALAIVGDKPLEKLTDLFAHVNRAYMSLPQFFHYPHSSSTTKNFGPAFVTNLGVRPEWPQSSSKQSKAKIFAYLSPAHGDFEPFVLALKATKLPALIHAKGISSQMVTKLSSPNIRFESTAVKLGEALEQATLVISHASLGTVSAAALAGKVQLGLPQHMEQEMVGRRLLETGAGLVVPVGTQGTDFKQLLTRLTEESSFSNAASVLANNVKDFSPLLTGDRAVQWIESFL